MIRSRNHVRNQLNTIRITLDVPLDKPPPIEGAHAQHSTGVDIFLAEVSFGRSG